MKRKSWKLAPLALLAMACGGADTSGPTTQGAPRNQQDLGRYVSGAFLLSQDTKYDKACNYFDEGFMRGLFKVDETTPIETIDGQSGCDYVWNNKKQVTISTTGRRPFQSMYQAEYFFDSLYDPSALAARRRPHRDTFVGQFTEDNVAEGPTEGNAHQTSKGMGSDSSAANDSSQTYARVTNASLALTNSSGKSPVGKVIHDVGEKAIWEENKRTLHILHLHHVFHIAVNQGKTAAADLSYAKRLGTVLIDRMDKESKGGLETAPSKPIY